MDRPTPTVSELVRLAVEICDRDGRDPALSRFEAQLEDDDAPVTAVDNPMRLAVRAQWYGDPPEYVADRLEGR